MKLTHRAFKDINKQSSVQVSLTNSHCEHKARAQTTRGTPVSPKQKRLIVAKYIPKVVLFVKEIMDTTMQNYSYSTLLLCFLSSDVL